MKIFLTGGTGFVGKHLTKSLRNHEILYLTRQTNTQINENLKPIIGNLSDIAPWKQSVIGFNPDAIVHLSWEGIPDFSYGMSLKNLIQGTNLFSLAREIKCKKVVALGSCWEYGGKSGELNEDDKTESNNSFLIAKHALYIMGKEIFSKINTIFIWGRLFYAYGPGQKDASLIPHIVNSLERNEVPKINNLDASEDFIYVKDVADALLSLVEKCDVSGIYNIGSGKLTSVKNIVKVICDKLNIPSNNSTSSIDLNMSKWANIEKITQNTGWYPKISIEEGIGDYLRNRNN